MMRPPQHTCYVRVPTASRVVRAGWWHGCGAGVGLHSRLLVPRPLAGLQVGEATAWAQHPTQALTTRVSTQRTHSCTRVKRQPHPAPLSGQQHLSRHGRRTGRVDATCCQRDGGLTDAPVGCAGRGIWALDGGANAGHVRRRAREHGFNGARAGAVSVVGRPSVLAAGHHSDAAGAQLQQLRVGAGRVVNVTERQRQDTLR